MANNIGKAVWFDYFTNNVQAARAFYCELFGWSIEEWQVENRPVYPMFKAGGKAIGGISEPPAPKLNNTWLAYIEVPDLNMTLQHILAQGGSILVPEKNVPHVGRWVIAADAQGAVFSPFQPFEQCANEAKEPALDEFCWHELMTTDREKAFHFYEKLFSWNLSQSIDMGPMGIYQLYGRPGQPDGMGGMMNITPQMQISQSFWLEYVRVENVDETIVRVAKLGGKTTFPAMDVSGGRIAGFVDNQGGGFAVWAKK